MTIKELRAESKEKLKYFPNTVISHSTFSLLIDIAEAAERFVEAHNGQCDLELSNRRADDLWAALAKLKEAKP